MKSELIRVRRMDSEWVFTRAPSVLSPTGGLWAVPTKRGESPWTEANIVAVSSEKIVAELESGQAPLERSIEMYERGAALKAHCEKRLEAARLRVEKIVVGPQGPEPEHRSRLARPREPAAANYGLASAR